MDTIHGSLFLTIKRPLCCSCRNTPSILEWNGTSGLYQSHSYCVDHPVSWAEGFRYSCSMPLSCRCHVVSALRRICPAPFLSCMHTSTLLPHLLWRRLYVVFQLATVVQMLRGKNTQHAVKMIAEYATFLKAGKRGTLFDFITTEYQ